MKLRKARLQDVEDMLSLINHFAEEGLMLPRSRNTLYESVRDFLLAEEDGKIVGCGGLHIIWEKLAEIRALAVAPEEQGKHVGQTLVAALTEEAQALGCDQVFALTYSPVFFERCGFHRVDKEKMPQKVWKECINCVKFPNCDEVAVIYDFGETESDAVRRTTDVAAEEKNGADDE
ncbi:Gcn5-related N-acetyltransferase (GNAT) domain protein [Acididesulfobacillus acetoxydans]|uniref:GCN5-related N-acetyltransferase = DSM 18033 n=1 Tax=Acididesulfobacillus acetoxydans TaxID=1561005 RepID=A0A8S0W9B5_9FIRM|nr:N-acetyltransferase [Acididesulfobacillus acetoxydans]CAA7602469.1 Gcn5-related N-acetyltransferase (GNAT) domain protein [Acididesulfobacillus acetoxydans]CEJ05924.1 GCN5-related N-acetyltransferase = DSM 18033 [Acididesulfobacillus acetoxydans]